MPFTPGGCSVSRSKSRQRGSRMPARVCARTCHHPPQVPCQIKRLPEVVCGVDVITTRHHGLLQHSLGSVVCGEVSRYDCLLRSSDNWLIRSIAKQHAQRVAGKLGETEGLIYLLGQYSNRIEDSDQQKTWRQRRYFYYMSGVDVANCCLTYDIKHDKLFLYIPQIHPERVVWEGRGPTIREAEEK